MSLGIRSWWAEKSKNPVLHNIAALFGTQVAAYAFPLVMLPYLARVLGVYEWGVLAFVQSLGTWLAMLVEFGFGLSATREVARQREDAGALSRIAAGVLGAQAVLVVLGVVITAGLYLFMPEMRRHPVLLWTGAMAGVLQSLNAAWFFLGLERMRVIATVDVAGKALAALLVFLLVHHPQDVWRVTTIQLVIYSGSAAVIVRWMYREVRYVAPTLGGTWQTLRRSAEMFFFRSAISLYTTGNVLILGLLSSPLIVSYYAGAEKLSRASLSLLNPVSQTLFPRVSHLITRDRTRAIRIARLSFVVMFTAGLCFGAVLYLGAPVIVHLMLGVKYLPAVRVLRVLSLLVPMVAISNVLGIQWMLPLGLERVFNKIIVTAGLLNVALALVLARSHGAEGMAAAVVTSEGFVTVAVTAVLAWKGLSPLSHVGRLAQTLEVRSSSLEG